MLLQETLRLLDAELERVLRIRDIVAGLAKGPALPEAELKQEIALMAQAEAELPQEPEPSKQAPKRSLLRRSFTRRTVTPKPPEPRALSSTIPAGPVVISRQALAREREMRVVHPSGADVTNPQPIEIVPPDGAALESLTNDLARRWLSRSVGSPA